MAKQKINIGVVIIIVIAFFLVKGNLGSQAVFTSSNEQWLIDKCDTLGGIGQIYGRDYVYDHYLSYCLATQGEDDCMDSGYTYLYDCSMGPPDCNPDIKRCYGNIIKNQCGATIINCETAYSTISYCRETSTNAICVDCLTDDNCDPDETCEDDRCVATACDPDDIYKQYCTGNKLYNDCHEIVYDCGAQGDTCGFEGNFYHCINAPTCSDSDNGKVYNTKGKVTDINGAESPYDYCTGNVLTEYYCYVTGYAGTESYTCPNGCLNGACSASPPSKNFEITAFTIDKSSVHEGDTVIATITVKNNAAACDYPKDDSRSNCNYEVEFGVYPQRLPYTMQPDSNMAVFDLSGCCSGNQWVQDKEIQLDPGQSETFTMQVKAPTRSTYVACGSSDYAFDTKLVPTVILFKTCGDAATYSDWKTKSILPLSCVTPGTEVCNGLDDDCDGVIDDGACNTCTCGAWTNSTGQCGTRTCNPTGCTFTDGYGSSKACGGGTPGTYDDAYCADTVKNPTCYSKGYCEANEKNTKCVSQCAFFEKWNKTDQECGINMAMIILIVGGIFAIKMMRGGGM